MKKWMPDYDNAGSPSTPSSGTTYTATADGWYDLREIVRYGNDTRLQVKVNDQIIIQKISTSSVLAQFSGLIQVATGDKMVIIFNSDSGQPTFRFIPGRWV